MNTYNKNEERDEVLFAFHQACERATADEIIEWTERYPQFAEDIRAHAAVSRDWVACEGLPAAEADGTMLERAYSNALSKLYDAELKASASGAGRSAAQGFQEILAQRNKEIFELAGELDIARSVLADLFNGWMLAPVRKRLIDAVTSSLSITRSAFDAAFALASQNPRFGYAKAEQAPIVIQRSCDDIIRDSNMSEERKAYWLEEV
jgi:hypothetical protein